MNRFANPLPVSGPPAQPPPQQMVGNTGIIYGTQSRVIWNPGETDPRGVCDALKAPFLWRFSAFGRVLISISYGTQGTREVIQLRTPLVITIPGQFSATATPLDAKGAVCAVTLTAATAGTRSVARRFVSTTPPTVAPLASVQALPNNGGPGHGGGGCGCSGQGAGKPIALDDDATFFFPLTCSSLTIAGVAVYVSAFQIVPLVAGSILTSGSGFQEFEA